MKNNRNIKQIIKKKIEINSRGEKKIVINRPEPKKILKINTTPVINTKKSINSEFVTRKVINICDSRIKKNNEVENKTHENFIKKYIKLKNLDYDVVICIPSYNRYNKLKRIIETIYNQETKYSFKFIILNDGSDDNRYDDLSKEYKDIWYIKNETPNGKLYHWYCYNQLWSELKNINCMSVLQMDDDFILCDNFLNKIVDIYLEKKIENNKNVAVAPHIWSFKKFSKNETWWKSKYFVDGIAIVDPKLLDLTNYQLNKVDDSVLITGQPAKAWSQISDLINKNGLVCCRIPYSLVYHDGNEDSKLHGDYRVNGIGNVYTQNFIK